MAQGIGNLDFSDIYGGLLGAGGEKLNNLVKSIFQTLRTGGYFGTEAKGDVSTMEELGITGQGLTTIDPQYTFKNLLSGLKGMYGEGGTGGLTGDIGGGMGHLYSILEQLSTADLHGEYSLGRGDVSSEIGSQMNLIRKNLSSKGKGSRYSNLATGGIPKGGRKKYATDYYGLLEKEKELTTGLQENLTGGFQDELARYLQFNPSTGL